MFETPHYIANLIIPEGTFVIVALKNQIALSIARVNFLVFKYSFSPEKNNYFDLKYTHITSSNRMDNS